MDRTRSCCADRPPLALFAGRESTRGRRPLGSRARAWPVRRLVSGRPHRGRLPERAGRRRTDTRPSGRGQREQVRIGGPSARRRHSVAVARETDNRRHPAPEKGRTEVNEMQSDDDRLAKRLWRHRGQTRPAFAIKPRQDQESVWDYPRPPILVRDPRLIDVRAGELVIASTRRSVRILETASPPTFYLPREDVHMDFLRPAKPAGLSVNGKDKPATSTQSSEMKSSRMRPGHTSGLSRHSPRSRGISASTPGGSTVTSMARASATRQADSTAAGSLKRSLALSRASREREAGDVASTDPWNRPALRRRRSSAGI